MIKALYAKRAEKRTMRGCDQCQLLRINGVVTHEIGCPNSHIDPTTGKCYRRRCAECGDDFLPEFRGDKCCGDCKRQRSF